MQQHTTIRVINRSILTSTGKPFLVHVIVDGLPSFPMPGTVVSLTLTTRDGCTGPSVFYIIYEHEG